MVILDFARFLKIITAVKFKTKHSRRKNYPALLHAAGLRPTRQRLALASWLFDGRSRHITAEEYRAAAKKMRASISLATVYNSLKNFTDAGLLRQVALDNGQIFFDTNTSPHHHIFHEDKKLLLDLPASAVRIRLPQTLSKKASARINVVVHVAKRKKACARKLS